MDVVRVERVVRYHSAAIVVNDRSLCPALLDAILFGILRHWWMSCLPMPLSSCYWKILFDKKILYQLLQLVVFTIHEHRLVKLLSVSRFLVRQWLAPLLTEKHLKPSVSSNSMDEDRNRKDAALSHSDGGPLKLVRDSDGLESEGLTLWSGSVLKGRTLPLSQISDPQALAESGAVTELSCTYCG